MFILASANTFSRCLYALTMTGALYAILRDLCTAHTFCARGTGMHDASLKRV